MLRSATPPWLSRPVTGLRKALASLENDFPGVPCTGTAQTLDVVVPSAGPVAFKQGSAAASASVTVFNPETFDLITETVDSQSVRITKK